MPFNFTDPADYIQTPGQDGGAIGVVSLEDVIEEMIGEEIGSFVLSFLPSTSLFVLSTNTLECHSRRNGCLARRGQTSSSRSSTRTASDGRKEIDAFNSRCT